MIRGDILLARVYADNLSAEANSYIYIMTKAIKALALLFELESCIFKKAYIPRACRVVTRLHQCVEYLWAKRMSLPLKSYPQFLSVHTLSTLAGLAAVFLNTGDLGNLPNSHFTFCGELLDISPPVVDLLIAILGVPVWSLRLLQKAELIKCDVHNFFTVILVLSLRSSSMNLLALKAAIDLLASSHRLNIALG